MNVMSAIARSLVVVMLVLLSGCTIGGKVRQNVSSRSVSLDVVQENSAPAQSGKPAATRSQTETLRACSAVTSRKELEPHRMYKRLPRSFERPSIKHMKVGDACFTMPWMLFIDLNGRGWLTPAADVEPVSHGTSTMLVERLASGYVVTIPSQDRKPVFARLTKKAKRGLIAVEGMTLAAS